MADKQMEDMKSKQTHKRLEAEKNYEEVKERLEKEKDKLMLQVAELTEKTTREEGELKEALTEKHSLTEEFNQLCKAN